MPRLTLRRVRLEPALDRDTRGAVRVAIDAAAVDLWFDYAGRRVRPVALASPAGGASPAPERDVAAEARACRALESFGPVELSMVEDWVLPPGQRADYVVALEADDVARLAFAAHALPQLESLGFHVEFEPGYPWRALPADAPWYVRVPAPGAGPEPPARAEAWLDLELGIEVDGRRVDLMPALLALLNRPGRARGGLDGLVPGRPFVLEVGQGERVLLPPERLRTLLAVLDDLAAGRSAVPAAQMLRLSAGLAAVDAELRRRGGPGLQPHGAGAHALLEQGRAPSDPGAIDLPPVEAPAGLQATLRPYQEQGLAWLQGRVAAGLGGILADDMGLGKTLQTIAHVLREKEQGRLDRPALIVAPTSLVGNWRRELGKFAPSLRVLVLTGGERRELRYRARRADVVLTSYPILVRDADWFAQLEVHLVILDEAQAIKNPDSQAHAAARRVPARHRLCLTGTPVENGLGELWAQLEFLNPGRLGSEEAFKHHYRIPIEREGNRDRLDELRARVRPLLLRRTKEEVVPELPPKTELVRPVELRGAQRDLYESIRLAAHGKIRAAIAERGLQASTFTILDALMKLRQVCCDPRLVPVEQARAVRESAKTELLYELLEQQVPRGRRVLIFSQFATMLQLIGHGLRERGIASVTLTGATRHRDQVVQAFESGRAPVFLISLKAGGTGLNLTSADTVIHYDPWWNPAAQAQATDRAYRIGQKNAVFVYNLIVAGSVEERMLALQQRKRDLAQGILEGASPGTGLSVDDVEVLMAPLG